MNTEQYIHLLDKVTTEGVAILDSGIIVSANEALCRLTKFSMEKIIGMPLENLIMHPEEVNVGQMISGRQQALLEVNCKRKDNTTIPVELTLIIPDSEDSSGGRAILFRDISKRKVIETELKRTEAEYRRLFEDSKDAIYISSREGRILEVNEAAIQMFGYSREEMLQLDTHILYKNPEDRYKFQIEVETYRSVKDYEVALQKKDGSELHCLLSSSIKMASDGSVMGYQGIIKDITALKKTDELRKAKDIAEQSARLKEQFLANMSHEMRTPLHAIFGITNLMLDTQLTEKQKQFIELVKSSTDHLLVIINDILDFSKIEAGKMVLDESEFSILDLISNLCQTLQFRIDEKKLDFECIIDESIPEMIIGDAVRLNQVLINLLINAVKFTEKGKVSLTVSAIEETDKNVNISFRIRDSGIGIPADKLDHIFDSFTQVSQETTRKFGGTGLGLTITRKLILLQGGTIQVSSDLGKGSEFECRIKFKKGKSKHAAKSKKTDKKLAVHDLGSLNILVVEDNKVNQLVTIETIKKWGSAIKLDIAENGAEAIAKLKAKPYDLVIMDIQMPVMDGLEATFKIRSSLPAPANHVPIIAMTAYATTGEADKCYDAGMNEYISKPFDPKELYQKIAILTKKIVPSSNGLKGQIPTAEKPVEQDTVELSYLDKITEGDAELKRKMIDLILRETPEDLDMLQLLCDKKDWPGLRAMAHKFKSTATFLGNKHLENLIKELEEMAEEKRELEKIEDKLNVIVHMCNKAIEVLTDINKSYRPEN